MKYYAVARGRNTGIYTSWQEAQEQIIRFPNALFKSFESEIDAIKYLQDHEETEPKSQDFRDYLKSSNDCVAYIDGSCMENKKASSGVVLLFGSPVHNKDYLAHRNIAGELSSAIEAMNAAYNAGFKKLTLFYDYQGIEEIALGRWQTRGDMMKAYKETYEKFASSMEIEFVKIKGHTGNKGNDLADEVAGHSLKMEK